MACINFGDELLLECNETKKYFKISTKYKGLTHSKRKLTHFYWSRKHENQLDPLVVSHPTLLYSSYFSHCGFVVEKMS